MPLYFTKLNSATNGFLNMLDITANVLGIPRIKAMTDIVTAGYDQGSTENPVGVTYG